MGTVDPHLSRSPDRKGQRLLFYRGAPVDNEVRRREKKGTGQTFLLGSAFQPGKITFAQVRMEPLSRDKQPLLLQSPAGQLKGIRPAIKPVAHPPHQDSSAALASSSNVVPEAHPG